MEMLKQVQTELLAVPYPEEFREGARNAITTCLRIAPDEKVTLITDESCLAIAASLAAELAACGCTWNSFVLEDIVERPLNGMPSEVLDDMETSQVSIFACAGAAKRIEVAHGHDGRGEPSPHASRAHGEHHA